MDRFDIHDDYVEGYCNNGKSYKFDLDDFDMIRQYHWYNTSTSICTHTREHSYLLLARMIYDAHPDLHVPSGFSTALRFNGDSYDYRKSNLYFGNTYVFIDDYVVGTCFDSRTFYISNIDYDLISPFRWHVDPNNYVTAIVHHKGFKQHRLIMGIDGKVEVDHINHDTCDNRRCNLRVVSRSENCINRRTPDSNKSGLKGVYWSSSANKWCSQINYNGVRLYLGSYDNYDDACNARKLAEETFHGEYRYHK